MNNHLKHLGIIIDSHQLSDLVVRASALRLGGWGSIPGRVIPKTIEKGPNSSVFMHHHNHHHYRVSELENPHHSRTGCCTYTQAKSFALQEHLPEEQSVLHLHWTISMMAFGAAKTSVVVSAIHPFACTTHFAGDPAVDAAEQWLLVPMPLFGHGLSKYAASELQSS